ncbi:hypothetical protein CJ030_MR6G007168 [Morella rubra]|uniref:Cytochrome P450 CYP736A12 n=1 Tax=Morella rubra TaxID=262757 RepID=A0A6A1VF13_9ROSI|nr:hypothetical protein CJ030_MR6G007168 [Morella rubra]
MPMPIVFWTWTLFALSMIAYLLREWTRKSRNKHKKLPPGPRGFPLFGSLHMLGEFPHQDLHRLAQKYGPIMHLRLGLVPTIVVSSPQAAELFLKEHDLVFASRPPLEFAKHIIYDQKGFILAPYGSYWRNLRKMCTLELLSNVKIDSFKFMRKEELGLLLHFIREAANSCVAVDLSATVSSLSADITCRMVFGKKYTDKEFDERGFKDVIQEGMQLAVAPNLGDFIPCLAPLDLQGLTRKMKAVRKIFDAFLEKIIDEHVQTKDENKTKDFVDVMLSFIGSDETNQYRIERENIKALMLDMLAASMDTSATAIEWTLSELMKHPRVMKKLQKELENVVGLERMSRVMINAWAIGRDPSVWSDAEKFFPERFVGNDIDLRGRDFQLIPFGSGRRGCPGMQLGLTVVRLVVAQLVHCFDWELPDNMLPTELDMTEEFGLTVPRAKHLLAIPTCRLQE